MPETFDTTPTPIEDLDLVNSLIDRKEAGEPVDADIATLLDDMERLGFTSSEAYLTLDAYRPGSESGGLGLAPAAAETES